MMRPTTAKSRLLKGSTSNTSKNEKVKKDQELHDIEIQGKELSLGASLPKYKGLRMTLDENAKEDKEFEKIKNAANFDKSIC